MPNCGACGFGRSARGLVRRARGGRLEYALFDPVVMARRIEWYCAGVVSRFGMRAGNPRIVWWDGGDFVYHRRLASAVGWCGGGMWYLGFGCVLFVRRLGSAGCGARLAQWFVNQGEGGWMALGADR